MEKIKDFNGYNLKLSNGQCWQFIAYGEARQWLKDFAHVMGLEEKVANGCPRILFGGSSEFTYNSETNIATFMPEGVQLDVQFPLFRGKSFSIYRRDNSSDFICDLEQINNDGSDYVKMLFSLHPIYLNVIMSGGFPFHAALVERDGHGVLLAGPGGTGKSTCFKRIPAPWNALCDDEVLLCRCNDGHYEAHPFPTWSDYIFNRQKRAWSALKHVPVDAIFFLKQSNHDRVRSVNSGKAALLIYESAIQACNRVFFNRIEKKHHDEFKSIFNNACELSKKIPSYELDVSIDGKFWEQIDENLQG